MRYFFNVVESNDMADRCICTQLTALEPTVNPDCPIHGPLRGNSTNKRYFFNVVESAVLNPDFEGYRSVRIEVTDRDSDSHYPIYEANALIPGELMDAFIDVFDFKEADLMPHITWACKAP